MYFSNKLPSICLKPALQYAKYLINYKTPPCRELLVLIPVLKQVGIYLNVLCFHAQHQVKRLIFILPFQV